MNKLYATLLVGLLSASSTGGRADDQEREPEPTPRSLAVWMSAVEAHTPGFNDQALRTITSLSPDGFAEIRRLLGNRRRALSVESFNAFVHRGALLHMDAAMVQAGSMQSRQPPLSGASRFGRTAVLSTDGGFDGLDATGVHWEFGRTLIDMTLPQPSEDRTARLWYVTAAAFLANRSLLADQLPHLSKAAKIFPDDPDLLFANGRYYEAMASPRVRPMIDSTTLPSGVRVSAPSARASWRLAEDFFRRAAEARPDFTAARIRRGRALDMLGRHDEAIRELRDAATHTTDPALLYYAALFEGAAQESLGNVTMARELRTGCGRVSQGAVSAARAQPDCARPRRSWRRASGGSACLHSRGAKRDGRSLVDLPSVVRAQSRGPARRTSEALHAGRSAEGCRAAEGCHTMRRVAGALLIAALAAVNARFVAAQSFKSGTESVRVDVLVSDRGQLVGGLTGNDFELLDNGVRQTIVLADFDQLPLNVVLVFDMSGSVTPARLGHLQRAAGALLDALTKRDQAGLITFSHVVMRPQEIRKDVSRLREALARAQPAGRTALVDGTYAGMMLGESSIGRALLIVLSDGVDTSSWLTPESVIQTAKRSDVVAYGVAVGQQKPEFLRDLAEATGGQVFENESDDTIERRFLAVLDEFRRRYVLMYTPTSTEPGWHRLEVRLKGRRGSIKARPGYLADPVKTDGK